MPMSELPLAERIARVLAGAALSKNADGSNGSAAKDVDDHWKDHLNQAMAVLHTMREPDHLMAEAGDPQVWTRMVEAAIQDAE
ncbi:hypothetical protein [Sphingomonas alba]|uniref:Uncharacterized protein n=1 Tax=Sphingomonas alba TaxID=2908208 RepID=A0ABT0RKB9_9SPHN|nr:hypothetical protein [Sphingomonas alba]MCL6682897.1 hypothetical protein [Sphingomonas alba]